MYYRFFCLVNNNFKNFLYDFHIRNLCYLSENSWGLYECYLPESFEFTENIIEIKGELRNLLYSAIDYPPAIGFSRDEIFSFFRNHKKISVEECINQYKNILKKNLNFQAYDNCFLAQSLVNNGFRCEGYYYWIVGFNKDKNKIYYLSQDDYYIYEGELSDFIIDDFSLIVKLRKFSRK